MEDSTNSAIAEAKQQNPGERPLEASPQGRYVRFDARLGSGAYKTVYKAYDTDQGIDVAWNAIDIASLPAGEKARIIQEVQLLQKLEHKNIINFYGSWFSKEKNQVVFITEIMTSGTLKSYIKRVQFVKWKIIKRWCIQILEGLNYLHSQTPPIIHRDLKCDNIFINGNTGDLRIGDLGLSTQMAVEQRAQSVLGTPEFMAPELYDENYDEKVDIYAFGMCVLEMVTKDVPYSECMNPAQIYKKVIAGIRPKGLQRIISDSAREFIELCLSRGDGKIDVTAGYLLGHTFLLPSDNDDDHRLVHPEEENAGSASASATTLQHRSSFDSEPSMEQMSLELNMESSSSSNNNSKTVVVQGETKTDEDHERRSSLPNLSVENIEKSGNSIEAKVAAAASTTTPSSSSSSVASAGNKSATSSSGGGGAPSSTVKDLGSSLEPMMDEKSDDHHADEILASMPGNESEVQDNRVHVMAGRGQRLQKGEDDSTSSSSSVRAKSMVASQKNQGAVENGRPPLRPHASSVPDLEKMPPRPKIKRDEVPKKDLASAESINLSAVNAVAPKTDSSSSRRRGTRHDIKSAVDPEHEHSILLNVRLVIDGKSKEIKFSFNLFTDVPHEVASELAADVRIPEPELATIVDSISYLVTEGKIKNLNEEEFDVWEDAPEPYAFTIKKTAPPTPSPGIGATLAPPSQQQSTVVQKNRILRTHSDAADGAGRANLIAEHIARDDAAVVAANALLQGFSKNPRGSGSGAAVAGSGKPAADDRPVQAVIATSNAGNSRNKDLEGRLQIAQSAFDQREMNLQEAIRSEEEKHKREMDRYRKKMEEFEQKKHKAALARQQRLEQVTADFKAEVQAERKNSSGNGPPPPILRNQSSSGNSVIPPPTASGSSSGVPDSFQQNNTSSSQ